MKSMTVRGLDPALEEKLKQAARKEGKSVNQIVIDAMRSHFGLTKEPHFTKRYNDLDPLFGRWTQAEFDQIQGKIDSERTIDEELWK